jgi:hypothetical protein
MVRQRHVDAAGKALWQDECGVAEKLPNEADLATTQKVQKQTHSRAAKKRTGRDTGATKLRNEADLVATENCKNKPTREPPKKQTQRNYQTNPIAGFVNKINGLGRSAFA